MDKELINSQIKTNVYHIISYNKTALHKHQEFDEVFH
jgi:hypothetical protein